MPSCVEMDFTIDGVLIDPMDITRDIHASVFEYRKVDRADYEIRHKSCKGDWRVTP